ncbi:MAG TPA: mannosyltransferase family protein [Candidatus Dormibacteraeota bacterium]
MLRAPALRLALPAYVVSRLLLFLAGWLANALLGYGRRFDPQYPAAFQTWLSWDAVHYLRIAQQGYPSWHSSVEVGFFPVLPLVLVAVGANPVSALIFSVLAGLAGVVVVVALTRRLLGDEFAGRTAWVAAFWPTSFVLSAVYTEGLFLALAAGALWAAWRGRVVWVLVLGLLAGALRPNGFALAVPLLILLPGGWRKLAALAPAAGMAAFAIFLWVHAGHAVAFAHSQTANHHLQFGSSPFNLVLAGNPQAVVGLLALIAAGLLLWRLQRMPELGRLGRWRWAAVAMVVALLAPPLAAGTLVSFGRYAIVAFPLFWAVASLRVRPLAVVAIPAAAVVTFGAGTGVLTP